MKHKKGDKLRVSAQIHGHEFQIGEKVKVKEVSEENQCYDMTNKKQTWWMEDDELEVIKK